jgi:surface antigen
LLRTDAKWRNGGRWLSLALLGGLAINATPIEAATASSPIQSWISLTNGQLCRTWSAPTSAIRELNASIPSRAANTSGAVPNLSAASQRGQDANGLATGLTAYTVRGANSVALTRCASQWRISANGALISDAPNWVPNPTGAWPAPSDVDAATLATLNQSLNATNQLNMQANPVLRAIHASQNKAAPVKPQPRPAPRQTTRSSPTASYGPPPGGVSAWAPVPGHPTYTFHDYAGDPYSSFYGVCTWWAWYMRRDEPLGTLGMARDWIANARARGLRTGYTPAVGATAVFSPYTQGAGGGGHAAHVVAILSNGWFIITEMNFYWNGGGWGRVDTRYVHTGSGVAFIY